VTFAREHLVDLVRILSNLHLARHIITHPVFEKAQDLAYTQDLPPHHVLATRGR
jgi:hypothetical protein